ncbi:MAG: hypothetical protein JSU96_19480 [Acidobacteriota bacterium]|nr:MAG: hypothetical protein JSU96_19480 [Acidobacteriota bacterium]
METALTTVIPLPDSVPLAAPPTLFWGLLLLTFFLHLIPMNLVLGGSVILVVNRFRGGGEVLSSALNPVVKWFPVVVAAAVSFGVAPLLFVQVLYGRLLYTSSVLIGWAWWLVIPVLILAYYGVYYSAFRSGEKGRGLRWVGLGSAAGFLLIGFTLSNNMSLMLRPEQFLSIYRADPSGWNLNWSDPTLIPRYLHMLIGSIGVSGMALALTGYCCRRSCGENAIWMMRQGGFWFLIATVLNFLVGTWFLLSYDAVVLRAFMSQGAAALLPLVAGIILGLIALAVVFLDSQRPEPGIGIPVGSAILALTLIAMILVRDQIRQAALASVFEPASWTVPQWGAISIFFVLLLAAVVTVLWMLTRGSRNGSS